MFICQDEDGSGELDFDEFVFMIAGDTPSSTVIGNQIMSTIKELRDAWSMLDPGTQILL